MLAIKHCNLTEESFKCIFDDYKNKLYGYILALTHSTYAAEEITQEIFIKLWVRREVFPQLENVEGYIFRMARNKTLNYLRKAAYDSRRLGELQGMMLPSNSNADEKIQIIENDRLLKEAIHILSPQQRLVYLLSRYRGLTHQQIAIQLHLSRNTVKNHMVKALQAIRQYITSGSAFSVFFYFLFFRK